jgi:hypothetical protein
MKRRISRGAWPVLAGLVAMGSGCAGLQTPVPVAQSPDPAGAQRPRFTTRPPENAQEGFPYRYRFAAQDPSGEALSFQLVRAPEGARADDREVVWVPQHRQCIRPQWFTLRVVNGRGVSQDQTWSVIAHGDMTTLFIPD